MATDFDIEFSDLGAIAKALAELGPEQGKAINRASRVAAKKVLIDNILREAPEDTGALNAEAAWKISSESKPKQGFAAVRVGVDPNYSETRTVTTRKGESKTEKNVPARYLHLVTLGTTHSRKNPFLQRAFGRSIPAMERVFMREIEPGIEKTWRTIERRRKRKRKASR